MIGQSEKEQLAFYNVHRNPHKMSACRWYDMYWPISSNFSIVYLSFVIHKLLSGAEMKHTVALPKPSWHLFLYQNLFIFISSKTELGVQCHRIATLTQTKRPNKTSRICPWGVCMSSQAVVKMSSLCFIFKCHSLFHDLNALPTALKERETAKSQHGFLLAININDSYRPVLSHFIHDEKHPQSKNFLSWGRSKISVWVALGRVIGNHNHLKVQFGSAMPAQAARSFLCATEQNVICEKALYITSRCHLAVEKKGENHGKPYLSSTFCHSFSNAETSNTLWRLWLRLSWRKSEVWGSVVVAKVQ